MSMNTLNCSKDGELAEASAAANFQLEKVLKQIRHYLPSQAPLKDFIHHNTLHAFQGRCFKKAVQEAAMMYGAREALPMHEYQAMYRDGKIGRSAIEAALQKQGLQSQFRSSEIISFLEGRISQASECLSFIKRLCHAWDEQLGFNLASRVNPLLFRLVSQYLDQGISSWQMPKADHLSLYDCVRQLMQPSGFPVPPLTDPICRALLAYSPDIAIHKALKYLVADQRIWERYLHDTLFEHPGWSGLVSVLERSPELLPKTRKVSLLEFTALKLILEVGILSRGLAEKFKPVSTTMTGGKASPTFDRGPILTELLQDALEQTYYERTLSDLRRHSAPARGVPITVQALFCLDDRECSIRRHIETIDPSIETFGVAGFFGVDAMVLKEGELFPVKSCPAPIKPRHLIYQHKREGSPQLEKRQALRFMHEVHGSSSKKIFPGLLGMPAAGLKASLRFVFDVMNPVSHAKAFGHDHLASDGPVKVRHEQGQSHEGLFQVGYTIEEMAERVAGVLRQGGLMSGFAPLVMVVAHGSSSVNNPHFAAYDCGACSGRPGAPNARAFAFMANCEDVRGLLRSRHGIEVPRATRFVPAIHDTCQDTAQFFDSDSLTKDLDYALASFRETLEEALALNALERCRRFELVPQDITPKQAREIVRNRSLSIFEPRPELNHANNAACIVGRRELTRGLFLDRRAFLQSYDWRADPDGEVLRTILSAIVPVCGGINLEYYFSRLDPQSYGSGTKLPHNVIGLLGVVNGSEGDILTGLPTQMTEMHDPIRLLMVIEQQPQTVLEVLKRTPSVAQWFDHEWMKLALVDPESSGSIFRYCQGDFFAWSEGEVI